MLESFTDAEIRRSLHLRAIEWCNWPAFVSALFAPILLIWVDWWRVLLGVVFANCLWYFVRYHFHSFRIARAVAVVVMLCQWPVAAIGFGILIYHRHFVLSLVALLWPLFNGFIYLPGGKIGVFEYNFAKDIGYLVNEDESKLVG